ncbi:Protein disulfide isomerase crld-1 [Caenorhabditis elegans]|uniref:Isoform b of Protein disulfide isomerase crld-1 n=1 Tax=Caenorhabditis elegans TaxID=6239 RepID=Q19267-2|nr:Protein disulfide isomerase crld-1 [Caenorhabditis elegans]CAO82025.1 Protein disulfide isomerase crld-1 [Caenorhabditis elegans]|eukprot:NP_001122767.1 Cysteine Rich with egf (EGF) Like Domains homolog [Caenorhabditis elegans]
MSRILLLLAVLIGATSQKEVTIKNEKCRTCNFLVSTFDEGLKKTARHHFAGGDTAWEEKNLGKYKTSETRLIEVLEGVCKKSSLPNMDNFMGIAEIEFKCSTQLEKHEETIEEFYYNQQHNNMSNWLCVEQLKLCCPDGHFGKNCEQCPGLSEKADVCFGKGSCHGDGSREGSGKCKCETGYTGNLCRYCDIEYFEESRTVQGVVCKKCHEGCLGVCSSESSKGCSKCKNGWKLTEEGCADVNECQNESACTKEHEICVNTVGSFKCECKEGYKKDDEQNCQFDVEALKATEQQAHEDEDGDDDDEKDEL